MGNRQQTDSIIRGERQFTIFPRNLDYGKSQAVLAETESAIDHDPFLVRFGVADGPNRSRRLGENLFGEGLIGQKLD